MGTVYSDVQHYFRILQFRYGGEEKGEMMIFPLHCYSTAASVTTVHDKHFDHQILNIRLVSDMLNCMRINGGQFVCSSVIFFSTLTLNTVMWACGSFSISLYQTFDYENLASKCFLCDPSDGYCIFRRSTLF